MKRRHSFNNNNNSPSPQSTNLLLNQKQEQQTNNNNNIKLINNPSFTQNYNLNNLNLFSSSQFLPQQIIDIFNEIQSPSKNSSSNEEISFEEKRSQEEAFSKLTNILIGSNLNNEEENDIQNNGFLELLFTNLLLFQQQQYNNNEGSTSNSNSEENLEQLIGQLFNQFNNNKKINNNENNNFEENNKLIIENKTETNMPIINGRNKQNLNRFEHFQQQQYSNNSEIPLDLSNIKNNLILSRPPNNSRPFSNCSLHSSLSSSNNNTPTAATAPPLIEQQSSSFINSSSLSDCQQSSSIFMQSQNNQNFLLSSFPSHHPIFEGISPQTITTSSSINPTTFLHPAAALLFGLPPQPLPSLLLNSLPPIPNCSPSSSPSQLINSSSFQLSNNFISSMCHQQSSQINSQQTLGDDEDDWEQMMEISCTDEAEKIRELAGDNAQAPTDPNQCIICRRVLSCKSALQMHYRTHTGERPFKCKICQRAFTTKGNLKTHMGVHKSKAPLRQHIFTLGESNSNNNSSPESNNNDENNSDLFPQQQYLLEEEEEEILNHQSSSQQINNFPFPPSPLSSSSFPPQHFPHFPQNFPSSTFMSNFPIIPPLPPHFPISTDSSQRAASLAQLQLFLSSNPQLNIKLNNDNSSEIDHGLALSNLFLPLKNEKMVQENERITKEEENEELEESSSFNKKLNKNENNKEEKDDLQITQLPSFFIQKLAAAAKFKIDEHLISNSSNKNKEEEEEDEDEEYGKTKKKKKKLDNEENEEIKNNKIEENKKELSNSPSLLIDESIPQNSSFSFNNSLNKEKEENPLENLQRIFSSADSPPPQSPSSSSSAMPPSSTCFLLAPIQKPPNAKHHCRWCMKGFSSSSALQIHTRTHTGDRPYKCEICERAFTTRGNLKVHKGTHSLPQNPSRRGRRIFDMEDTIFGTLRPPQQQQPLPNHLFSQSPPLNSNFDEQQRQQQIATVLANLLANTVGNNNNFGILNELTATTSDNLINNSSLINNNNFSETNQIISSTTTSPLETNPSTSNQLTIGNNNEGQQLLMGLLFQHLQNIEMAERIEEEEKEKEERKKEEENKNKNELNKEEEESLIIKKNKKNIINNNKDHHSSENNNIIIPVHNTTIL